MEKHHLRRVAVGGRRGMRGRARRSATAFTLAVGIAVLALLAASASAGVKAAAASGGTFRFGGDTESAFGLDTLNPFAALQAGSDIVEYALYPSLLSYAGNGKWSPNWATKWKVSADGRTWTFHVVPGKWSDGEPMTARDAAWTGNTILKYAKGPTSLVAGYVDGVASFSAPSDDTLVVRYKRPSATALGNLAGLHLLPQHVWEQQIGKAGAGLRAFRPERAGTFVAGGAFQLKSWDKGNTFALMTPNPNWVGPKPKVDAIGWQVFTNEAAAVQALRSGQVDEVPSITAASAKALKSSSDVVVRNGPLMQASMLQINSNPAKPKHRELLDPVVREAISLAIDRSEIIEVSTGGAGKVSRSFLAAAAGDYIPDSLKPPTYNPKKAAQLLEKAGYTRSGTDVRKTPEGEEMRYVLLVPSFTKPRLAEIVQKGLAAVGITVSLETDDYAAWQAKFTAPKGKHLDMDMTLTGLGYQVSPAYALNSYSCAAWEGGNTAAVCDKRYEKLHKQQLETVDPKKHRAIVRQMQEIIVAKLRATVPLVDVAPQFAYSKKWIVPKISLWDGANLSMFTDVRPA